MDHTTITAEASRNIGVAAKAKDLNTSLLPSDEMKKLEPMAVPPPINGNFYPDGGPGIQFGNINNGMLMQSSSNGDMVDGSKQLIWFTPSFVLNSSPGGGINSYGDVYVSNADNAPQEPYTSGFYEEDYPPLTPPAPREKKQNATYAELKAQLGIMEGKIKKYEWLAFHCSRNDLMLCAAEILKWSVNRRGEEGSDGKLFFWDKLLVPVKQGSRVMGLSLLEYQKLSCRCFKQRNSTAHFPTIQDLDRAVARSKCAIELFPHFKTHLPDQCQVIERFEDFKKTFPCNFTQKDS